MSWNENLGALTELAENMARITGLKFVIYDSSRKILLSRPNTMCEFCAEIRKSPELTEQCLACDRHGFNACDRTGKLCAYHCHMNVLEVVSPILDKNYRIGYVMIGQFLDYDNRSTLHQQADRTALQYHLDAARLHHGIDALRSYDAAYLHSVAQLLEMSASYIWMNHILSVNQDGFAYNLDCYIHEHLADALTIPALCRTFGISASALYQVAKRQFGCGASAYINRCRIAQARQLLSDRFSVGDAAAAVGICDVNYFIRLFKKETGITPKKYQLDMRAKSDE